MKKIIFSFTLAVITLALVIVSCRKIQNNVETEQVKQPKSQTITSQVNMCQLIQKYRMTFMNQRDDMTDEQLDTLARNMFRDFENNEDSLAYYVALFSTLNHNEYYTIIPHLFDHSVEAQSDAGLESTSDMESYRDEFIADMQAAENDFNSTGKSLVQGIYDGDGDAIEAILDEDISSEIKSSFGLQFGLHDCSSISCTYPIILDKGHEGYFSTNGGAYKCSHISTCWTYYYKPSLSIVKAWGLMPNVYSTLLAGTVMNNSINYFHSDSNGILVSPTAKILFMGLIGDVTFRGWWKLYHLS